MLIFISQEISLIINNKENIIDTIRSRCQIIKDFYSNSIFETIPSVWKEMAKKYLMEIGSNINKI